MVGTNLEETKGARSSLSTGKKALLFLLAGYSVIHLGYSVFRYNVFTGIPTGVFYEALNFERDWTASGPNLIDMIYPPLYFMLFLPLAKLGVEWVTQVYYFFQFILFFYAIALMVKAVSLRRTPSFMEYLIAGILSVNFQPFLETLAEHKVEGIEFFLISLAIYSFRKGRDLTTGILIAVAANLKYLPAILALYFLFKRESKVVLGVAGALTLYLIALVPALGLDTMRSYVIGHPMEMLVGHEHEGNRLDASPQRQTLGGTIYRFFATVPPGSSFQHHLSVGIFPLAHPHWAYGIAISLKLTLVALYLFFITRRRWPASRRQESWSLYLLEISLTLLMIFVIAQAGLVHYGILVLPAFCMVGLILYHHWSLFSMRIKALFAAAYALSAVVIPGGLLNRLPPHPIWGPEYSNMYFWLSLPFYGYGLLAVCILLCYRRILQSA